MSPATPLATASTVADQLVRKLTMGSIAKSKFGRVGGLDVAFAGMVTNRPEKSLSLIHI